MIRTSHPFLSRRFPFGEGARSNDAKDNNWNSEYDTWAGQCYLVFTRRIQPAHITVTSRTLKRELQGKFRDIDQHQVYLGRIQMFAREEYRQKKIFTVFGLLSPDEQNHQDIQSLLPVHRQWPGSMPRQGHRAEDLCDQLRRPLHQQ